MNYSSDEFELNYTYTGRDLGALWSPGQTAFRLWAPTAQEATVGLYRSGDANADDLLAQIPMQPDEKGTWTAVGQGNLNGLYYTYRVLVEGKMVEACDPYARTTGVNGQRAMVIDLKATDPEGWDADRNPHDGQPITDAVIYELHLRDLSMHSSSKIRHKGKFLGLTETGRKTPGGHATGLDYIRNLGVTHVHLLPVFDYGYTDESRRLPQFNWGYDPENFNVPEGSYATDPCNGAVRVREMKQMVKALHDSGLSVVMDVVYNHVYDAGTFCVNKIVPGYFSRGDSNGSCCGNDTASERSMVRKYIVDSVLYWADEYHIDGFRFDLVGLLDVGTIHEIMETVHKFHPGVIFYGEGWNMRTQLTKPGCDLAVQENAHRLPGFAFFSDTIRDLLRGSVFSFTDPGYVTGGYCTREALDASFMGMPRWAASPSQCVNYVSCHDNHTLFDRITLAAPEAPFPVRVRMNNLAAAFVLLSQGVPFMQAGEELLRTKPGKKGQFDHNSYRSSDRVNAIKWNTLDKEEYQKNLSYYQGLIRFRKAHPSLRLGTREAVWQAVHPVRHDNSHVAAYHIDERTHEIFVIFNADAGDIFFPLPQGQWEVHIDADRAGTDCLRKVDGVVRVPSLSALVLSRKKPVSVVAALLWEKDKLLICQRPENKARGLLWEFVGGKVEPGESKQQALVRECMEELGVQVTVGSQFMEVTHDYPDMLIRLTLFHAIIPEGFPKALEHNALKWVHPRDLDGYDFCPADAAIVREVKRIYGNKEPL
ncbi:MAG: type I pullulanase [Eubacteriales bacterium]|nr:type I pullulanase [Eubacteriales bacterium]